MSAEARWPPPAAPQRLAPMRAAGVALAVAVPVAVMFGLRAGVVAAPLLALVLWRAPADRLLGAIVAALLGVVVPAIYLGVAVFGDDGGRGGNETRYPADRISAHWVAVAAVLLVAVILWRTLAPRAPRRRPPGPAPGDEVVTVVVEGDALRVH